MKQDVLFLCQFFYPEQISSATLPFDTASYLAQNGISVDVMCGYPKEYRNGEILLTKERINGIRIKRLRYLRLPHNKRLGRMINFFSFTLNVLCHIPQFSKYKIIVVYSNPPILPLAAVIANILFNTKIVYVSYDVYPEIAYPSGNLRKGGVVDHCMKWLNYQLFSRAEQIIALTDEMRDFLIKQRRVKQPEKIVTIPNWAHEENTESMKDVTPVCTNSDFVISYLGNMGICQEMDTLLGAIERLADDSNIHFLFGGSGSKLKAIRKRTAKNSNVEIKGFLSENDFMQALTYSSCCVLSLERGLKGLCAPSRYSTYLYGSRPVIAIVEDGTYLYHEVINKKVGKAVKIGDVDGLVHIIKEMYRNRNQLLTMSENAANLYRNQYSKSFGLKRYKTLITEILA